MALFNKNSISKKWWLFTLIFAVCGAYFVYQSLAVNKYNPYNPPSEEGIATYYDNTVVGGPGHCAAIHYARGVKLKVTNKKVGNDLYNTSITCTVSDAGPFGDGRVIDLNTDDFRKLAGSTSLGVLPVLLEIVPEAEPEAEPQLAINCNVSTSENPKQAAINECDVDETAITFAPPEDKPNETQKKPLERVIDFSRNVFTSLFDIF